MNGKGASAANIVSKIGCVDKGRKCWLPVSLWLSGEASDYQLAGNAQFKKFIAFDGTRILITMITRARYWCLF
jgi:hypothetical protein